MKITVRLYKRGKVIKRLLANRDKWRKIYSKIASAAAQKWYIRVEYGKYKNCFGNIQIFYNDGIYTNEKEAKKVFKIFIEK
jgi:hypothetical protein